MYDKIHYKLKKKKKGLWNDKSHNKVQWEYILTHI